MESSQGITDIGVKAILNFVAGGISILGCLWVFHFYFKTTTNRSVTMKLILLVSIADFIFSIANVISPFDQQSDALCTFEAVIRIFSMDAGLFWATCIAVSSYLKFVQGEQFQQEKFFRNILVLGLIVSTIYTVSPIIPKGLHYGPVTFGCYVTLPDSSSQFSKLIVIIIYGGAPSLAALIVTLTFYFILAKKSKEMLNILPGSQGINLRRLFLYPAVMFLAYIPSFIDNLIELYDITSSESYVFTTIHIVLTHSVGFTNALVYGLQRKKYYKTYEEPRSRLRTQLQPQTQDRTDKNPEQFSDEEAQKSSPDNSYDEDLLRASLLERALG